MRKGKLKSVIKLSIDIFLFLGIAGKSIDIFPYEAKAVSPVIPLYYGDEKKDISVKSENMVWENRNDIMISRLWGSPDDGVNFGVLTKLKQNQTLTLKPSEGIIAKITAPDYIKGLIMCGTVIDSDETKSINLKSGSYFNKPNNITHTEKCSSKDGCTILLMGSSILNI